MGFFDHLIQPPARCAGRIQQISHRSMLKRDGSVAGRDRTVTTIKISTRAPQHFSIAVGYWRRVRGCPHRMVDDQRKLATRTYYPGHLREEGVLVGNVFEHKHAVRPIDARCPEATQRRKFCSDYRPVFPGDPSEHVRYFHANRQSSPCRNYSHDPTIPTAQVEVDEVGLKLHDVEKYRRHHCFIRRVGS